MTRTVICRACGWASYAVSTAYAERKVAEFNRFYDRAPERTRKHYSGHTSIETYCCLNCGGTAFRPKTPEDRIPPYVTLSPVICDELADDPAERPH